MHVFARDRPLADAAAVLAGTTHLLLSRAARRQRRSRYCDALAPELAALPALRWAGYLSTTGRLWRPRRRLGRRGHAALPRRRARPPTPRRRAGLARARRPLPACRSTSSAWPGSMAPAAARSMRCGRGARGASTSPAMCSRASMSPIWSRCCAPRWRGRARVRSTMSATTSRRRRATWWNSRQRCSA